MKMILSLATLIFASQSFGATFDQVEEAVRNQFLVNEQSVQFSVNTLSGNDCDVLVAARYIKVSLSNGKTSAEVSIINHGQRYPSDVEKVLSLQEDESGLKEFKVYSSRTFGTDFEAPSLYVDHLAVSRTQTGFKFAASNLEKNLFGFPKKKSEVTCVVKF